MIHLLLVVMYTQYIQIEQYFPYSKFVYEGIKSNEP